MPRRRISISTRRCGWWGSTISARVFSHSCASDRSSGRGTHVPPSGSHSRWGSRKEWLCSSSSSVHGRCSMKYWGSNGGNDAPGVMPAFRRVFVRLRWHCLAILVLGAAKIPGVSLFALPLTHPYAARLIGPHIGTNFQMFALFGLQAILPLKRVVFSESAALMTLFITTAVLTLVFIAGVRHFGGGNDETRRPLVVTLFLLGWFFLMLFPPLTLENHFSRYYLTAALPPPRHRDDPRVEDRDAQRDTERTILSRRDNCIYGCKCDGRGGISIPEGRTGRAGRRSRLGKGRGQSFHTKSLACARDVETAPRCASNCSATIAPGTRKRQDGMLCGYVRPSGLVRRFDAAPRGFGPRRTRQRRNGPRNRGRGGPPEQALYPTCHNLPRLAHGLCPPHTGWDGTRSDRSCRG